MRGDDFVKDNVIVVNFTNKAKKKHKKNKKKLSFLSVIIRKLKKLYSFVVSFFYKKSNKNYYKNRYK